MTTTPPPGVGWQSIVTTWCFTCWNGRLTSLATMAVVPLNCPGRSALCSKFSMDTSSL
eukprot:CAMPEP_0198691700 /NCGR_PEP_ID=MMETSP1468-20131203/210023_1 /TAXON_ID=1461545 /ORGANISM="Mantoniella sp, Strain CCMP1436" /LENGTH=57 /DNA_ID=CAMNT_0044445111 /DNA_START=311 /DNA_END=484 /DNA_ORIENTATION=+